MIRTLLIEDEQQSREVLELMLGRHTNVIQIVGSCSTPEEGMIAIKKHSPELVFLDIEMPRMNGFEMLKKLVQIDFEIIFTTAYNKYAIDALRISAVDYLLKPIDAEELAIAIHKCSRRLEHRNSNTRMDVLLRNLDQHKVLDRTLTLSSVDGIRFIKMKDIIRLEANGRYTKFFLLSKEVITASRTLGDYEESLCGKEFFRIHEAHIINLNYIDRFHKGNSYVLLTDRTELPLARRRKEDFLKIIPKI